MDFKTLVNTRYSVRKFSSTPIEEDKLKLVLESARKAPSAVNFQPYRLYVVRTPEILDAIKACYHRSWIKTASLLMVVVGLHDMAWKRAEDGKDHVDIDAAIFIDHLMLQATELGIGSCWVCNFDILKVKEVLGLKAAEEPIAFIPMGYSVTSDVPVKKRKGVDDLVVWL
jgi:nitroreductase